MIIGKNITKSFGEGQEKQKVLDKVNVTIGKGEFVSVMGPSGSGKSTLMYALSGMDTIDEGCVVFEDKNLQEYKEEQLAAIRRKEMGFVFQQPTLLKNLNILDNIILSAIHDNRKEVAAITDKARKLLDKTGIAELEEREITQVSGGQLQRAGICRALMNEPKIIFADEPTGALNSKSAQGIMNIFSSINKEGTAILLVTHDAKVAAYSERVLFMCDGKIESEINFAQSNTLDMDKRIQNITVKMQEIGI